MTVVVPRAQIERALAEMDVLPLIAAGFAAYSDGRCNIPPVGELVMEKGEVHIKYGCITGDSHYVIKIASGFYGNPAKGLPSGNGAMLVFSQETGALETVLLDEGLLTDIRTAAAGAVAASRFAPRGVDAIGVIGCGVQARLQVEYLEKATGCRRVIACGRNEDRLKAYRRDMEGKGFVVETTADAAVVTRRCRLIVTTTPSASAVLRAADVQPGTHINAIGSDTPHKQELEAAILSRASRVIVDSVAQCRLRGEAFQAIAVGQIRESKLEEIGEVILGRRPGRESEEEITVFDSTGLAVQDIQIAKAVASAANPGMAC